MSSNTVKEIIQRWKDTKNYVESLGFELGQYDFQKKKCIILKDVGRSCRDFVGYIKEGDLDSIEITNEKYKNDFAK